jgi:hypothetical protein
MGRPEKAKLRKLTGSPNVLFSIGEEGGRLRSVNEAVTVEVFVLVFLLIIVKNVVVKLFIKNVKFVVLKQFRNIIVLCVKKN